MTMSYLSDFVYGATDGVITTSAISLASVGAGLPSVMPVILGFANLLSDGFSMATSSYFAEDTKENHKSPFLTAIFTYISFVSIGILPIIPFLFSAIPKNMQVLMSIILTMLALGVIGGVRRKILRTVILGTLVTSISYITSVAIREAST